MYEREKEFINNEDLWPTWPVLPVVKKEGKWEADGAGFLISEGGPVVYIGNIFAIEPGPLREVTKNLKKFEYPDFDGLLDIWRID